MKKYFLFLFLLFSVLHFSQSNVKLPFVGIRSFSFCGGNACESYIEITKNGMCRIESYGFDGTVIKEYNGKYAPTIWIYSKGKKERGYRIIGNNTIISLKPNGQPERDCEPRGKICESYLYYTDKNGNVRY